MLRLSLSAIMLCVVLAVGCHSAPPAVSPRSEKVPGTEVFKRPTIAPPAFKLFHQTKDSLTLVTDEHATDEQIEALIFQLHDAARAHSFDTIGLPQKFIDARDPMIWFHIYRGAKCASEKYIASKLPCGPSYHAAGDYTLGGFKDKDYDDGILIHDEAHETHLWTTS